MMKTAKKIRKFLRNQGRLRWYKKFLRVSAFPFGLIGDDPISLISISNNPFNLIGSGYEQAILDRLRLKWISCDSRCLIFEARRSGRSYIDTDFLDSLQYGLYSAKSKIPKFSDRVIIKTPNDSINKFNNERKIKPIGVDCADTGYDTTYYSHRNLLAASKREVD